MRLKWWQGVVTLIVIGFAMSGCGSPAPSGPSWMDQAHVSPSAGPDDTTGVDGDLGVPCLVADDGEARPDGSGPPDPVPGASISLGVDNDPYTATGARQVPGPDMRLSGAPASPVTTIVAAPVDPDEHVAARNPDGEVTGPVPSPKVIGATPAPGVSAPPASSAPSGGAVGGGSCPGDGL